MLENLKSDDAVLKKLVQRNLPLYFIPNVIANTIIPYFSFKNLNAVHLFKGEYCIARFLLPMALLLPFIITFDILKKTIALSEDGKTGFVLPHNFTKNKFMFKMAGINGIGTSSVILVLMILLQFSIPKDYSFNGELLSVLLGLLAGTFSIVFTLWPIKKIKELKGI
ncbi:hypothetical protein CPT03_00040 [Pedobacter ginsengisoli]|uniref:Uncharacterized protein n=1 Tax=Pedobacter ginsengisoli TaxID=363852 RepID=A0A2D1U040_9SPHI|nr:hypothetical protein [Pedobacter ginsengisoli]ATP54969.1 hypothetical protein CPT03_00040 [Pedobacter ginsengisoli]